MQIAPYLFFNGSCEEALDFYAEALGGKVTALMRYAGSPMDTAQLPVGWKNKVMHASFEAEGARFMASDALPGPGAVRHGSFSMALHCDKDATQAGKLFQALATGGQVTMPFDEPFWGGHFGMLVDRFGVPWMVSCDA